MRFSAVCLLIVGTSMGLSQAFLQLSGTRSSSNPVLNRMQQQQQERMRSRHVPILSRGTLRMSDESDVAEETNGEVVNASAPVVPQAVGPALQTPEEKRKEEEEIKISTPPENKWASGAFKRGVALQAVVLSIVIFLQFQPPEVANLAICLPFAKGGCVGIVDYFRIVFTGAPIPPL